MTVAPLITCANCGHGADEHRADEDGAGVPCYICGCKHLGRNPCENQYHPLCQQKKGF